MKNLIDILDLSNKTNIIEKIMPQVKIEKTDFNKVVKIISQITDWDSYKDHPIGKKAKEALDILMFQEDKSMIMIDNDYWTYKGYDVYLLEHPKLSGKYEICMNDVFIERVNTLKDCKIVINIRTLNRK